MKYMVKLTMVKGTKYFKPFLSSPLLTNPSIKEARKFVTIMNTIVK